jgi:hypothetical protein
MDFRLLWRAGPPGSNPEARASEACFLRLRQKIPGVRIGGENRFGKSGQQDALVIQKLGQHSAVEVPQKRLKWNPRQVNGLFLILVLLAFIVMVFSDRSTLPLLTLGVLLLDAGVHGNQSANQTSILTLNPALHSRINSAYKSANPIPVGAPIDRGLGKSWREAATGEDMIECQAFGIGKLSRPVVLKACRISKSHQFTGGDIHGSYYHARPCIESIEIHDPLQGRPQRACVIDAGGEDRVVTPNENRCSTTSYTGRRQLLRSSLLRSKTQHEFH